MKKLLAVVLVATLLFTGCGKKPAITAEAKEYGYFNFENLEWGMTPTEVMKKLGKKESDFEIQKVESDVMVIETSYTLENTQYKGQPATIFYSFYGIPDVPEKQALWLVNVAFTNDLTEEEMKAVWKETADEVASYEIALADADYPTLEDYSRSSKSKAHDLPQEMQDKINAYARKIFYAIKENGGSPPMRDIDRYQYTLSLDPKLSSVRVGEYPKLDNPEKMGYRVSYRGDIGQLKLFARLAEAEGVQ